MRTGTIREAVTRLADRGMEFFRVGDLVEVLDVTPDRAKGLAHRLAKSNFARRLERDLYALLDPADWDKGGWLGRNRYVAAAALVRPDPYFLAYYTAMDLHRMIHHPLRTVFVAVTKQRPEKRIGPVRFRFVTLNPRKFFGHEERQIEGGPPVKVADLERAFVDCVDRPELCGGIEEVFRGFARRHDDLNHERLIRYVLELGKPTLTKRLGFLLETIGHGEAGLLWELERVGGRTKHFFPLDKTRPVGSATRNRRWELIINTDIDRLFQANRT